MAPATQTKQSCPTCRSVTRKKAELRRLEARMRETSTALGQLTATWEHAKLFFKRANAVLNAKRELHETGAMLERLPAGFKCHRLDDTMGWVVVDTRGYTTAQGDMSVVGMGRTAYAALREAMSVIEGGE